MADFLFLQTIGRDGQPGPLPYAQVADILARHGTAVSNAAPLEFEFASDKVASRCWVIGDPATGVTCIGLDRPLFDDGLRAVVWDFMDAFGCAVFDDTLHRVYLPARRLKASLPEDLLKACAQAVQSVGWAAQLWPRFMEFDEPLGAKQHYALIFQRPDSGQKDFQRVDRFEPESHHAGVEINLRRAIANPGVIAVLQAHCRRVCWGLLDKPGGRMSIHFEDEEVSIRFLELKQPDEPKVPVTIVSPFFGMSPPAGIRFVADRELFHSMMQQAMQFIETSRRQHGLTLDASAGSVGPLAAWLESLRSSADAQAIVQKAPAIALEAGSYLADMVRRHVGGQLGYITTGSHRIPVVLAHRGHVFFPHGQVLAHLLNGSSQSVAAWFDQAVAAQVSDTTLEQDIVANIHSYCSALRGAGGAAQPLPRDAGLKRERLDYSADSLAVLDRYLKSIASPKIQQDPLINGLLVVTGAYLGEVIRSLAPQGKWRWKTYEKAASEDPDFAAQRPRSLIFAAVLDSAAERTYPLAQVLSILATGEGSCMEFAARLLGGADAGASAPPAAAPAPDPVAPAATEVQPKAPAAAPDAECPNCCKPMHAQQPTCPHCGANFTVVGGWRPVRAGSQPERAADIEARPASRKKASSGDWRQAIYTLGRMLMWVANAILCLGVTMLAMDYLGFGGHGIESGAGFAWALMSLVFYLPAALLCALGKSKDVTKGE